MDHTAQNLPLLYPGFYDNPAIVALSNQQRWSVSDKNKRPIDMVQLFASFDGLLDHGQAPVRGAFHRDSRCLVDLSTLTTRLPEAKNHAYYLSAVTDGVMVIDIEAGCPPELKDRLLRIPALYAERSMSGHGYHLVVPLPANISQHPIAASKKVLTKAPGQFEILLEHWVTFTRDILPQHPQWSQNPDEHILWDQLFAELAEGAVDTSYTELDIEGDKPEIPDEQLILNRLYQISLPKTLEDFDHDHSRYEFSAISHLRYQLDRTLKNLRTSQMLSQNPADYTYTQRAWLIYRALSALIDHRPKHDEHRNGLPLLLNASVRLLSMHAAQNQQHQAA